eukprot:188463-Prymnesium_polylepis.1
MTLLVVLASCLVQTASAASGQYLASEPKYASEPTVEDHDLAELTYNNQMRERSNTRSQPRAKEAMQQIGANWPCMWGERATGWATAFNRPPAHALKDHPDVLGSKVFRDGWKFTCGLDLIRSPCVVYSL